MLKNFDSTLENLDSKIGSIQTFLEPSNIAENETQSEEGEEIFDQKEYKIDKKFEKRFRPEKTLTQHQNGNFDSTRSYNERYIENIYNQSMLRSRAKEEKYLKNVVKRTKML